MASATINLIRTKTSMSPQAEGIEEGLRRTSYILLAATIFVGVLLSSAYFFLMNEKQSLEETKRQLTTQITIDQVKEAQFLAIRERIAIVQKAMGSQRPWSRLLDIIATFASPSDLTSVVVEGNAKAVITMRDISMEDVLRITRMLMQQVSQERMRNPQLLSLQLTEEGSVDVSLSFFPVF